MTVAAVPAAAHPASPLPSLAYLVRCELLKLFRVPAFAIPTLLFPVMFFAFFGLPNVGRTINGTDAVAYTLASYGSYAMLSAALFSFGVSVAAERGLGWTRLLRTTPMPPALYFVAKVVTAVLIGLAVLALLFAFGALTTGLRLSALEWATLVGRLVLGMVPYVALGLLIGYVGGPQSAPAIANLVFLPLSFASGYFIPLPFLPGVVQAVAPYLPTYHSGQLAWSAVGAGDGAGLGVHLAWLAGYTVLFLALALWAYRRDEGKTYG